MRHWVPVIAARLLLVAASRWQSARAWLGLVLNNDREESTTGSIIPSDDRDVRVQEKRLFDALADASWSVCGPRCARAIVREHPSVVSASIIDAVCDRPHALNRLAAVVGVTRVIQTAAGEGPAYARLLARSTHASDRHVAALISPGMLSSRRRVAALRILLAAEAVGARALRRVFHFAAATGAANLLHDAEARGGGVLSQRDYVRAARSAVEHGHSAVLAGVARRIVLAEIVALFGAAALRYAREVAEHGARGDGVARFEAVVVDIAYELEARDAFGGAAVVRAAVDTGSAALVSFFAAVGLRLAEPEGVALAHALARHNWAMVDLVLSDGVIPSGTQREMHVFTAFLLTLGLGNAALCATDTPGEASGDVTEASVALIRELVGHLRGTGRVGDETLFTISTGALQAEEYARSSVCGV